MTGVQPEVIGIQQRNHFISRVLETETERWRLPPVGFRKGFILAFFGLSRIGMRQPHAL